MEKYCQNQGFWKHQQNISVEDQADCFNEHIDMNFFFH